MNYLREKLFDQYTWRERFEIVIDPKEKPASFPFDVVDIPLIIEMNSFNYKDDSNKKPGDEEDKEDDDEGEKEGVERYRVRFNQKMPKRRSTGINFKSTADQVPDFDIKKAPHYRSVEIQREEKKDGAYYPRVYFLFSLYRHPNTYICTSIIPLFLLNLCAIAVLFIPRDSFSDRMSAIVTLLLALFAFFPVIRNDLPKVAFLTTLEYSVYQSIGIIFLILVESILQYCVIGDSLPEYPPPPDTNSTAWEVDTGFSLNALSVIFIALLFLFSLANLVFYAFKFYKYTRKSKIYDEEPEKGKEEQIDLTIDGKKVEGDWLTIPQVETLFAFDKEELDFIRKVKKSMSFQYSIEKKLKKTPSKLQQDFQKWKESREE